MKSYDSDLCYRPEHKHLEKIVFFLFLCVCVGSILQGRAGAAGMFSPAHHPALAQANTGPTTQIFTWECGRHHPAVVVQKRMAAAWFCDLSKCSDPIAFCKLSSALFLKCEETTLSQVNSYKELKELQKFSQDQCQCWTLYKLTSDDQFTKHLGL